MPNAQFPIPRFKIMCAKGIDVSDWQYPVDWPTVAISGVAFAFTKATEGSTFVARSFAGNWASMKAAGLPRGAYHFFRASQNAQAQAELFLRTVRLEPDDLPPVLDVESTDGMPASTIIGRMTRWLDVVEQSTGRLPIIYTYPGFWEQLGTLGHFSDYPVWIAHYTRAKEPWLPEDWDGWTFWQYTDKGRINGIDGDVDINWFNIAREGAKGSHVGTIQRQLRTKGFYRGAIDGVFSSHLTEAAIAFQKAMGLAENGIIDIQTWRVLMGTREAIAPSTPPLPPIPAPPTQPRPPVPSTVIRLLDVCRYYQGFAHQELALDWLQRQLSQSVLKEFANLWRNRNDSQPQPIRLIDVCKSYRGFPHQDRAVLWLQGQVSECTISEFSRRWRSRREPPRQAIGIRLVNACRYYQGLLHQDRALQWLQGQVSLFILQEFARRWRQQTSPQLTAIHLINVCKYYQGVPHQQESVDWLQSKINNSTLEDFARRWRV